ncbi:MAG: hypothetical protein O7G83_17060 [Proteobacteria bacterium]|nr:hypothetical protein [Pseudomonadota bacterium]
MRFRQGIAVLNRFPRCPGDDPFRAFSVMPEHDDMGWDILRWHQ